MESCFRHRIKRTLFSASSVKGSENSRSFSKFITLSVLSSHYCYNKAAGGAGGGERGKADFPECNNSIY